MHATTHKCLQFHSDTKERYKIIILLHAAKYHEARDWIWLQRPIHPHIQNTVFPLQDTWNMLYAIQKISRTNSYRDSHSDIIFHTTWCHEQTNVKRLNTIIYKAVVLFMTKTATPVLEKATSQAYVRDLTDRTWGKNSTLGTAEDSLTLDQRETHHRAGIVDQAVETADMLSAAHAQKDLQAAEEDVLDPITGITTSTTYTLIHLKQNKYLRKMLTSHTASHMTQLMDTQYTLMTQLMIQTLNLFTLATHICLMK